MVHNFNQEFEQWAEHYGCSASFTWNFSGKDYMKNLVIQAIDRIIYRAPAPGAKTLADIVSAAERKPEK
jgi:hypothetical protein